ncbi:response regulator [Caldibacillus lycopersici]|uniref:Response regulator n=1 Tax=Perspicuibacillus lycopersici TaxID=1325689 RepID=A0AAE3LQ81_9BACI|nr:response regulator [Perspicuibacillus lycopersici]MCU9613179.1 response regulator [Perspicuibacillus lycopersici]
MKKILLADDSHFMRSWLKRILNENNKNLIFFEAENGCSAVQMYKQHAPNVVLLDITMPVINGLEALTEIIRFDQKAKIVMCSSLGQEALILDSIKMGAKDFVIKPNFHNLVSIVNKYL